MAELKSQQKFMALVGREGATLPKAPQKADAKSSAIQQAIAKFVLKAKK